MGQVSILFVFLFYIHYNLFLGKNSLKRLKKGNFNFIGSKLFIMLFLQGSARDRRNREGTKPGEKEKEGKRWEFVLSFPFSFPLTKSASDYVPPAQRERLVAREEEIDVCSLSTFILCLISFSQLKANLGKATIITDTTPVAQVINWFSWPFFITNYFRSFKERRLLLWSLWMFSQRFRELFGSHQWQEAPKVTCTSHHSNLFCIYDIYALSKVEILTCSLLFSELWVIPCALIVLMLIKWKTVWNFTRERNARYILCILRPQEEFF